MKKIAFLLILFSLTACAAPTPAATPTFTSLPPTPTPEPTKAPTPVPLSEIFKAGPDFYKELSLQDKNASKNFSVENGKTYLLVGSQKVEIDPASAGVNVDVNGKPLKVVDTGTPNPLTIRGVGESEGKVFSIAPETKIILEDDGKGNIKEKVFAAHWFEVIRTNHPVDQNATEKVKMEQREVAINDPVKVTVEQVQNGEWAQSVLLSGAINPFPEKWKFTGNALYHDANDPIGDISLLYTSDKIPIDFFGVTRVDGKNIGLRPFQAWNPADQKKI
ncbi:MAG: hypothetical protein HYX49_06010 [Chloroflexi bacterium]|nr:hypothetical protein [Chloroflexota bacterium]